MKVNGYKIEPYANLRGANLRNANLCNANLCNANLYRANLCDAKGFPKIPIIPNIDLAIWKEVNNGGDLEMCSWHACNTTHCRGGWAVYLAGQEGRELERVVGTESAAGLIYKASRPEKPIPNFYATNEVALESIKADAGIVD